MSFYSKESFVITCEECGSDHRTHWRRTKFCNVCRALRDLTFTRKFKTRACYICETPFLPTERGDDLCWKCDTFRAHYTPGRCAFCEVEDATLIRPDIAICTQCVRDRDKRPLVLRSLAKKKAELTANPIRITDAPRLEALIAAENEPVADI